MESTTLTAEGISAATARIHADLLRHSKFLDHPDFTLIHPNDLEFAFAEYDKAFFDGQIRNSLGDTPLRFALSSRMTSSGGKTASFLNRSSGQRHYEISLSTTILYECFDGDDHRPISACGLVCRNRLEAMQRVLEHEITHLVEMMLWDKSSCSRSRFHSITRRFFGHTENKHRLITPREKALARFGIKAGMVVRFRFDGVEHTGIVNRITRRATVLVEDRTGRRFSDGKRYRRFYIPVEMLEPAG